MSFPWDRFISFTKQERRGIMVFLCLTFLMITAFQFLKKSQPLAPELLTDYYFPDSLDHQNTVDEDPYKNLLESDKSSIKEIKKEKFKFNPNTISYDSLLLLGFSKFAANNLIKFRSKGGKIYNTEKLKSIYGVDAELIQDLDDLITYSSKTDKVVPNTNEIPTETKPIDKPKPKEKEKIVIEINSADTTDLVKINGIGKFRASYILLFRERLGGFLYPEQLVELKIIPDTTFESIRSSILINTDLIKPININTAEYKDMIKHPYFNNQIITAILKYRKQHGNFEKKEHISRLKSLKEEDGKKILPYIDVK